MRAIGPIAVAGFCLVGAALASGDTPQTLAGVTVVDAAGVAELGASGARIIDTRPVSDFLAGHLPAGHHVAYRERSAREIAFNPAEDEVTAFLRRLGKFAAIDRPVVFYCGGPPCWKSYKAAVAASRSGYQRVYWFRGGMTAWLQDGRPIVRE